MKINSRKEFVKTLTIAFALTGAVTASAMAQDVIGVQPVATAVIAMFKIIAVAIIGYGFFRLMSGNHRVEALVAMGIGGLGLAKTQAIVGLFGLG